MTEYFKSSITSGDVRVSLLNYSSGTYSRDGSGLVTVTLIGHGFTTGERVYLKFTTGDCVSKAFESITVTGVNAFTVQDDETGSTTGDILVSRLSFDKNGTYSRNSQWNITLSISSHGFVKGTYLYVDYLSGDAISAPSIVERVNNSGSFRIVKKNNPGGFYASFGVKQFHERLVYGSGVKVYVIDEGFNDIDPFTPGIQPISDLADFTIVDISTPGAGGGGLSHGGLVCGLLGASRRNGAGIIGICPDATLFLADVDNSVGTIFIASVIAAIDDAISRGVDIINISLGTVSNLSPMADAIQRAVNANILVFASAGNSGSSIYEYPAAHPGAISVASVDINKNLSSFNTRNDRVALFAPGERYPLPSPLDEADLVYVDGTSFSSPFASGLAALYISDKRVELNDPTYRPTREEIIPILAGEDYLNTSEFSYPAPGSNGTSSGTGAGAAAIAFLAVVIFVVILFMALSSVVVRNK